MGDNIRDTHAIKIQTSIESWLNQIEKLIKANIENFVQTFKEEEAQIEQLYSLLQVFQGKKA